VQVVYEGALHKSNKAGRIGWKNRYFTLCRGGTLRWFKSQGDAGQSKDPLGLVNIKECTWAVDPKIGKKNGIILTGPDKPYYLAADTDWMMKDWLKNLQHWKKYGN